MYPSMSPYCYAGNSPIAGKDPDGNIIIFVNGYRFGDSEGSSDDLPKGSGYWYSKDYNSIPMNENLEIEDSEFIRGAKKYFGDNDAWYVDGTGEGIFSTASSRKQAGKEYMEDMMGNLLMTISALGPDEKIQIVTHSMGAAYAEGMLEVIMNNPDLANRVELVVHFQQPMQIE